MKKLRFTWNQLEDTHKKEVGFSRFCRLPKFLRYLKIRTLIDYETLKLGKVNEFLNSLGISAEKPSLKIAESIRRKIFTDATITDKMLDDCLRRAYVELKDQRGIDYKELSSSLTYISERGDEFFLGWKNIFRDNIRLHIQQHFVREPSIQSFNELLGKINSKLLPDTRGYTIISWYNQWTSFVIEEFFMEHERVIPTLRRIDKVNFFFLNIPFDLKVTFLPTQYIELKKKLHKLTRKEMVVDLVEREPLNLAKWLYENQGEPRFSDSNRIFIVLADKGDLEKSWKLKASFNLIEGEIDDFLTRKETIPEIEWTFSGKRIKDTFRTYTDVILITRG